VLERRSTKTNIIYINITEIADCTQNHNTNPNHEQDGKIK
jgi:hypothetical protein